MKTARTALESMTKGRGRTAIAPLVSLGLALAGGCASGPRGAGEPVSASAGEVPLVLVDEDLRREVVPLTRALIRTGGRGAEAEAQAVRLVADRLEAAGLETELMPVGKGTARNLLARLPGRDPSLRPLLLLAHADAFPTDPAAWQREGPPYDGAQVGEHLVGRGALDMHGPLALMTLALVQLARTDVERARDVLLLVTAGGESDGAGIRQAAVHWPRAFEADAALGEGGFLLQDGLRAGEDVVVVSHAEKGRLLLRLSTAGERQPAERAQEPTAPGRLILALERVVGAHRPERLPPEVLPTAAALLEARGGAPALLARNPGLLRWLSKGTLARDPLGEPLLASTCAVVSLGSGAPTPVVPPWADAVVDCRLLPGHGPEAFRDRLLLAMADPRVSLEVLDGAAASGSPPDGAVVDVIRARLRRDRPSIPVLPVLTAPRSDLGWLRARGIPAYGFIPLRVDQDELASVHGPGERVRVRELEDALPRLVDIVAALAGGSPPAP